MGNNSHLWTVAIIEQAGNGSCGEMRFHVVKFDARGSYLAFPGNLSLAAPSEIWLDSEQ